MASKTTNKDTSVTSSRVDPNRVSGMPVLRHNISGKSTGAVSNWFECKSKWSPYLEGKFGRAGRVIKDGKFPIPEDVPEPRIPEDASTLAKRRIEEEYSLKAIQGATEVPGFLRPAIFIRLVAYFRGEPGSRRVYKGLGGNRKF